MYIVVIGTNHKTAPIHIREQFFLTPIQQDLLLSELKNHVGVAEAFVLSTCNRTEVYLHAINSTTDSEFVIQLIFDIKKIPLTAELKKFFYILTAEAAVKHFLTVSTGLDSLVLGEQQILGQVKTAVERARSKGMFAQYFNILANTAIRTGRKAQRETEIGYGGSSVSWAAVTMAEDILGTLQNKSVLIIGAGKMGEMTISQLCQKGVNTLYLMNRTGSTAVELAARFHGIPVSFFDIKETLCAVDVCFCAAGAPHYILDQTMIEKVMGLRGNRRLVLIDISIPRNIAPEVAAVPYVSLSYLDDLDKVVGENMRKRQDAVKAVEQIVAQKLKEFQQKIEKLNTANKIHDPFWVSRH